MDMECLTTRVRIASENHHLWNNNGTWWCHYTVHHADFTKERRRVSMRTANVDEARSRRDTLLTGLTTRQESQPKRP